MQVLGMPQDFMSELNLPVMSKSTLKRHEKKIGQIFVDNAENSCKKAQQLEKELSDDKDVEVSFDAGWQKRGSGFNYNSLTGHASMIGKRSGKVTCFDLRSTCCKFCEFHEKYSESIPSHKCVKNWTGSSKAMEPDMAVSMTHKMADGGFPIDVIHADNDSTTMVKLNLDFKDLKKKDDQNHTTKGITKSLISLSKCHKELKPPEVIPYINRCFMYAITQNNASHTDIEKALSRIVPHIFGDHELCDDAEWCTYKDDPSVFRYKSLPNGKPLMDQSLKMELDRLIGKYKDKSSSLTCLGSTQCNESFNQSIAAHAPKNRHYGGSLSLTSRVSSAVLLKNEGYSYLEQINEAAVLSPGQLTSCVSERLDRIKEKRRLQIKTKGFKKNRSVLKKKRNKKNRIINIHEPTTYQSNIGINGLTDLQKIEIPSNPLRLQGNESFVFFDLESTSLSRNSDITELAAVHGNDVFRTYVFPRSEISTEASKITGITCCRANNKMYYKGQEVPYKGQYEALLEFIDFLKQIKNPVLVGHNACNFDLCILNNKLKEFSLLSTFLETTVGLMDTLKISKRIFPKQTVQNYKQSSLVKQYLGIDYEAHSAIEDVKVLKELFNMKMSNYLLHEDLYSINFHTCKSTYADILQKRQCLEIFVINYPEMAYPYSI